MTTARTAVSANPMNFTENQQGNTVLERLRHQREIGRFCDVILVVLDKQFSSHRNILAACSPYFDSILKMHKVVKEQVTVNCQSPAIFESFLNYMYSGNVIIDRNNVAELLKLSHNFLVSKLKNYCAEYLDRYLDATNCIGTKELAEKYNMPGLLRNASTYLEHNINQVLIESSEVLEFTYDKAYDMLANDQYNISADTRVRFAIRWVSYRLIDREQHFRDLLTRLNFNQLDAAYLGRVVDTDPLFHRSESCLFSFLRALRGAGRQLPKYENVYHSLLVKYSGDVSIFLNTDALGGAAGPLVGAPGSGSGESESTVDIDVVGESPKLGSEGSTVATTPQGSTSISSPRKRKRDMLLDSPSTDGGSSTAALGRTPEPVQELAINLPPEHSYSGAANDVSAAAVESGDPPVVPPLRIRLNVAQHITAAKTRAINELSHRRAFTRRPVRKVRDRLRLHEHINDSESFSELDEPGDLQIDDGAMDDPDFVPDEGPMSPVVVHRSSGSANGARAECAYTSVSQSRIQTHIEKAHRRRKVFACNVCGFECKWNREYYTHMRAHFSGPPFRCDSCSYMAERIQMLLTHRMKHTDERPFHCEQCDYKCRTKTNLIAHERSHTGEKPFTCPECGRGFAIKSTLDQHLATHSDERPFVCDQCSFSTKYQSHLISHKRIHTGEVFRCQYPDCQYSSPKKSQLAAHMRTHMAIRSHGCSVCGRAFIEKSHLVRHERIHLEIKPFKCDHCDYASSRRDKLKEHVQKHHIGVSIANIGKKRRRLAPKSLLPLQPGLPLQEPEAGLGGYERESPVKDVFLNAHASLSTPAHSLSPQGNLLSEQECLQRPMSLPPFGAQGTPAWSQSDMRGLNSFMAMF